MEQTLQNIRFSNVYIMRKQWKNLNYITTVTVQNESSGRELKFCGKQIIAVCVNFI